MKEVFKKPYRYWLIGIFIVYLVVTIYVSEFYITAMHIPNYLQTIKWPELIASSLLSLIIAALVAISSVYAFIKYKERKSIKAEGSVICAATIGGIATGVCPACVTGFFPLLFSLFGISFSFIDMPFQGIEIQVLIIAILATSLYFLNKKPIQKDIQ
tara:strand:- start:328 stop:798 length:471 start_codon:yes stop_codon:yes gene_type:complete